RRQEHGMLRADVGVRRQVTQHRCAELRGGAEVFDVTSMKRIEAAVHHPYFPAQPLQLIERDDHAVGWTSRPFCWSSDSARSNMSTAPSGEVRAHSISSAIPCSSEIFGA